MIMRVVGVIPAYRMSNGLLLNKMAAAVSLSE